MKILLILLTALIAAAVGWHLAGGTGILPVTRVPGILPESPAPTSTVTDPALVFQKAFWKRPTSEEQILHAERREWQDKDGLSKWQWFITVKPGSALVDHLITDNAFMLSATPRGGGREHAANLGSGRRKHASAVPQWFPSTLDAETQILTNATGSFEILWDKEKNLLHATDSGRGFRPGAPEPVRPVVQNTPSGRLPTTSPPRP